MKRDAAIKSYLNFALFSLFSRRNDVVKKKEENGDGRIRRQREEITKEGGSVVLSDYPR